MRRPALYRVALALAAAILLFGPVAHAAPIPINACGQPINASGSYMLTQNVTASGGSNCITINAEFVTIDLAGFRIDCSSGALAGVSATFIPPAGARPRGITVRNGSITNCQYGVFASEADGSIIEGLRVVGSRLDGIVANGIIRNNVLIGNGAHGISGSPSGAVVIDNYATDNDVGIGTDPGSTVVHNTANANRAGIASGFQSTLIGNTAANNREVGITAGCPSNLTDNTAAGNATNLEAPGDCHVEDNVAP
jgi:hypothetical protein